MQTRLGLKPLASRYREGSAAPSGGHVYDQAGERRSGERRTRRLLRAEDVQGAVARYLAERSTARAHLRLLIKRKLDPDDPEALPTLDATLDRMERLGLLGDAAYAAAKTRSLVRTGRSPAKARAVLRGKGVAEAEVTAALADVAEEIGEDPTMAAAREWVRRKRAGHLREVPDMQRDLGRMGRAGFPYDVAKRALNGD